MIFGAGGQTGSGGVSAATAQGVWGIGVDQDEYFTHLRRRRRPGLRVPGHLGHEAGRPTACSPRSSTSLDGEFEGGIFGLTAENGGITYAPFHDADIPDDVADARSRRPAQGLADGSIKTGLDPVTGLPLGVAIAMRAGVATRGPRPPRRPAVEEGHERRPARRSSRCGASPRRSRASIANEDVDLTLHEGEVLCLLGENGAGKSTLMNTVFGLYQPDAGEILLRGEPVRVRQLRAMPSRPGSGWCTSTSS